MRQPPKIPLAVKERAEALWHQAWSLSGQGKYDDARTARDAGDRVIRDWIRADAVMKRLVDG